MKLTLTLMRNDDPNGSPIDTRSFDDRGLTLGRGGENDWVLDDPNRHLSKSHCAIEFEGGEFIVTDISTNGVFINQSPERLGRGNAMGLRDGDLIGLGEYLVRVEIAADGASVDAVEPLGDDLDDFGDGFEPASSSGGFGASGDPFAADADLPGHVQAPDDDPFAEFDLPPSTGGEADSLESFGSSSGGGSAAAEMIPEDFDIFGDDAPGAGVEAEAEADHVPSESEFFRPPAALPDESLGDVGAIPDDWDAELTGPLPQETVSPASRPAPVRAAPEPVTPPPRAPARPSPPPVAPVATAAPSAATADALTAFLSGAGLDGADIATADAEAMMHTVGAAFREMVMGLQETLLARSEIKSEFRLERTMIRPQENNPLKFSPTVDEAMLALLKGGDGGAYLPPVKAVHEGFNDLKAHQVAVMAGMQVALAALLRRFDPATLEKRLKSQSVLESILPAARRAKYWELYEDLYKEIAREAEDDFQGLFGREFATAYERQVKKL